MENVWVMIGEFILGTVLPLVPTVVEASVLIAAVIDVLKLVNKLRPGTVPDGISGWVSLLLNAAAWTFLWFGGRLFGNEVAADILAQAGQLALVLVSILTTMAGSKMIHELLKWVGVNISLGAPKAG